MVTATTLVTSVTTPAPVMAAKAAKIEPRKPGWRDGRKAAISRAREAAARGRQQGEDGRRKGQAAAGTNDGTAANPLKAILDIFGIQVRSPTPPTVATTNTLALITEVPNIGARDPRLPSWGNPHDEARSRAREAAARVREKGEEGRHKGVQAGQDAAERQRDQAMDKARRSLTAMVHDWRDELSSAKSIESSYRGYASSIAATASGKNNTCGKTTARARARPISPPASLPSDVRVNSADILPTLTLGDSLASVGVIAGVFGIL